MAFKKRLPACISAFELIADDHIRDEQRAWPQPSDNIHPRTTVVINSIRIDSIRSSLSVIRSFPSRQHAKTSQDATAQWFWDHLELEAIRVQS